MELNFLCMPVELTVPEFVYNRPNTCIKPLHRIVRRTEEQVDNCTDKRYQEDNDPPYSLRQCAMSERPMSRTR
jgi:hypothetical protein